MSLKDDIKDSLENFSAPMKQAIENLGHIGEDIGDAIADKKDEMRNSSENNHRDTSNPQQNSGCLKKLLVYGFVIILILALLKNGCSLNSTIERDGSNSETGQTQASTPKDHERLYDIYIRMTEENIEKIVAQEPIDTDALEEEFEFLLTCLASEYMFKSMAYGHFSGDYEATQYDHIPKKCNEVTGLMKKYIDAEIVNDLYTAVSVQAYQSFDDTMFNYDSCLIGTTQLPDIDAMWYAYFDSLVAVG